MVEPIACTLTPGQMKERMAEYRALGRDGLLAVDRAERRATLRFRRDPDVRRRVDELVANESRCCAFLDYRVDEGPDAIALVITAPEGGEAVLGDLAGVLAASC
jgi:hypothetical protein